MAIFADVSSRFAPLTSSYKILVVPTIRPECMRKFIAEWNVAELTDNKSVVALPWDAIVIVCDLPKALDFPELEGAVAYDHLRDRVTGLLNVQVLSREDILAMPGNADQVFSFADSAIRCFGYWWAWRHLQATQPRVIFSIDDDCYPVEENTFAAHRCEKIVNFVCGHISALMGEGHHRCQSTLPDRRVRGLPYQNRGSVASVLHVGLWENVLDLDSVDTLARTAEHKQINGSLLNVANYVWNPHYVYPMSGMNISFRAEITPFMYYPKQGMGTKYGRFDDIWCGLIVQRMCNLLGLPITCGRPYVWHSRASNMFANLIKESHGLLLNERLWEEMNAVNLVDVVCSIAGPIQENDYAALVHGFGRRLEQSLSNVDCENGLDCEYISKMGLAMQRWSDLFT